MENGCWALPSNHAKQAELALVKSSTSWEAARHEVDKGGRCAGVEAHQLLQRHLVVMVNSSYLTLTEDKGGKAA